MSARLTRILVLAALAPFLAGAHCKEDCGPPRTSVMSRPLEKTIYGPAVLVIRPRVEILADGLGAFERRGLRVDVSRPVAVVLTRAAVAMSLERLDPGKLKVGDQGEAFRVLAVIEQVGTLPLFAEPTAIAEAKRAGWDAIVLLPRERSRAPWEASVSVETGRTVTPASDPQSGRCIEQAAGAAMTPPEWRLGSLPTRCGDGVRQDDEDCDDGNREGGDGCSPYCTRER
jgi:cysteine-rich repeat protein